MKKIFSLILVAAIIINIVPMSVSAKNPKTTTLSVSANESKRNTSSVDVPPNNPNNTSQTKTNSVAPGTFMGGKEFSNSTMPTITLTGAGIDPFFGDYSESYKAEYGINPISNWNSMCQGALDGVNAGRAKRGLAPLAYNYEKQSVANTRIYEICNYAWYPSKNYPTGDPHIRPDGTWCYTAGETSEVVSYGYESQISWITQTPISIGNPEFIMDAESAYLIGYTFGAGFEASPEHWEILMRPDITSMNLGIEVEIEGTTDIHFNYSQVYGGWEAVISDIGVIVVY